MTTEQFTYWLQGFAEINNTAPTEEQWKIIKDHLQLVFTKVTPVYQYPTLYELNPPYNEPNITIC